MKKAQKVYFDIKKILFVFPAAAGVFLVLFGTFPHGPNVTHDSVAYIYAAESLMKGRGLVYFGYGTPFIQWPPLYPMLLAAGGMFGGGFVAASRVINGLIFGLTVYFSGLWLLSHTRHYLIAVLGCGAVLFSIPVVYVSSSAWSEPLFILLTLLFLLELENYMNTSRPGCLAAAALFAAAACLTRYVGIVVIATGAFTLFIQKKNQTRRLADTLLFSFGAALPTAVWLARNYLVSSSLTGGRSPSSYSLAQNISITLGTAASWFAPVKSAAYASNRGFPLYAAFMAAALAVLGSLIVLAVNAFRRLVAEKDGKTAAVNWLKEFFPVFFYIFAYTGYLIASATAVAFDTINSRLLSPIAIPLILMAFAAVDRISRFSRGFAGRMALIILLVAVSGSAVLYPAVHVMDDIGRLRDKGSGVLAASQWTGSEIMDYLKREAAGRTIYSNYPDAVYMNTGLEARYTPKKAGLPLYGLDRFKLSVSREGYSYIAWFGTQKSGQTYDVEELSAMFSVKKVVQLKDGVVYSIRAK